MIEMMDFKKYSVLEYNTILQDWFSGKPPEDTNIFLYEIQYVKRTDDTLLITFKNNHWLKVEADGWRCEAYSDDTRDVISNRHFFTKSRSSESLGLGHVAYTARPSKGITYKSIVLGDTNISRNENRVHVSLNRQYYFNVEYFKKYKEFQFNTHNGLSFYEKVSLASGDVLKTVVRVDKDKTHYGITIERDKNKRISVFLYKDFKQESLVHLKFKDCSIDNIFNKYIMFDFELTSEQEQFEIVESVRTLLKSLTQDTYNKIMEDNENPLIVSNVLKRIEVIESDEYQVQKRP